MLYSKRKKSGFSEGFSIKLGIAFSKLKLSPNQWTLISLIPAVLSFYFLTESNFLYAAISFIFAALLDAVDGSVARVTGKVSKFGAYLDTIVDRYVEGLIILGLFFAALPAFYFESSAWLFIYFFGAIMTTYAKAGAKEKEIVYEEELSGGLLERAERMIILFVGLLAAIVHPIFLTYIIVILAVLSNLTALQRILKARKAAKK